MTFELPLHPDQKNSLFHQALAERAANNPARAAALLEKLIQDSPDFAPAYAELGILYSGAGNRQQAEACLLKAVALAPNNVNCLHILGHFYRMQQNWNQALAYIRQAAQFAPSNVSILTDLLTIQRIHHDLAGVLESCDRILALDPAHMDASVLRADALDSLGRSLEARDQFNSLLSRSDLPLVIQRWPDLMVKLDRTNALTECLEIRIGKNPYNFDLWRSISCIFIRQDRHAEAIESLSKAHRIDPTNLSVFHDMGVVLRFLGKDGESMQWFERLLECEPSHPQTLRLFGEGHRYREGDDAFVRLTRAAGNMSHYPPAEQVQISYALGKAFDDIGDYATAFKHYIVGGRIHLEQNPVDEKRETDYIGYVKKVFSETFSNAASESGCDSDIPVFVIGMPRSGTTLVEQVLSSHPQVIGAGEMRHLSRSLDGMHLGEYPFFLQSAAAYFEPGKHAGYRERGEKYLSALSSGFSPDAKRIIDKMPSNYLRAGFIPLILPNAKIIHCRRHPVETCLSAFRLFFVEKNSDSSDLSLLGKLYKRYDDLMKFWRTCIPPENLFEIRYEDLVLDFENQARRLVDFVGLEWSDDCIGFHQSERSVSTASALQVRKPIYRDSINRWHRYAPYMEPLLDELGPLISQYETELATAGQVHGAASSTN